MLNLKKLLTKVLERLNVVGTVYQASWTATSSSGLNTQLTDDITLPAGTSILVLVSPTISANCSISFGGSSFMFLSAGDSNVVIYRTSASVTLHAQTAQSAAVTFTNINRGNLRAVKLA